MGSVRTQKEIRQRAPIWLIALLVTNLIIMAVDARDADGQVKMLRIWTQTFAKPLQSASSKASGATSGFFQQIWNFRSTAAENEQLKERLTQAEQELNAAKARAAEIIAQAEKRGSQIVEEAKANATIEANRVKATAQADLEQSVTRAKESLRDQVASLAVVGAEKILRREVDANAHAQMLAQLKQEL